MAYRSTLPAVHVSLIQQLSCLLVIAFSPVEQKKGKINDYINTGNSRKLLSNLWSEHLRNIPLQIAWGYSRTLIHAANTERCVNREPEWMEFTFSGIVNLKMRGLKVIYLFGVKTVDFCPALLLSWSTCTRHLNNSRIWY